MSKLKKEYTNSAKTHKLLEQVIDGRKLKGLTQKEILLHAVGTIKSNYTKTDSVEKLMMKVIERFGKRNS